MLDKQLFEGMGVSLTDDEQLRTRALVSLNLMDMVPVFCFLFVMFPGTCCVLLINVLPAAIGFVQVRTVIFLFGLILF